MARVLFEYVNEQMVDRRSLALFSRYHYHVTTTVIIEISPLSRFVSALRFGAIIDSLRSRARSHTHDAK